MMSKALNGKTGKTLLLLFFLNSMLALFVFYMVLHKNNLEDFLDVAAISFIVGSNIFIFSKIGVNFIDKKPNRLDILLLAVWTAAGVLGGSSLSSLFFYFRKGMHVEPALKAVFLYTLVFGSAFAVILLYFLHSRKQLQDSKKRIQEEKIRRLTLEKEAAIATLKLLQAQIEPHFLFNTLSNVISLFELAPQKAVLMLTDLNEYLRIALQRTREERITLDQELDLIRRYLDILKVRMGDRLVYEIEKGVDCALIDLPPMIIHPLVENAVKHGLAPKQEGGRIKIECVSDQDSVTITVSDTGLGIHKVDETGGIGLNNISKRLEDLYGDQASFILKENQPTGIKAIVKVPLK